MALPKCLIDGVVMEYRAAFRLDYTGWISPEFRFIGVGVIVEVCGRRYNGRERLKFYNTWPRIPKYNGRR